MATYQITNSDKSDGNLCKRIYHVRLPIIGYRDLTFDYQLNETLFILRSKRHSMEPFIQDGAFVKITQQLTVKNTGIATWSKRICQIQRVN